MGRVGGLRRAAHHRDHHHHHGEGQCHVGPGASPIATANVTVTLHQMEEELKMLTENRAAIANALEVRSSSHGGGGGEGERHKYKEN